MQPLQWYQGTYVGQMRDILAQLDLEVGQELGPRIVRTRGLAHGVMPHVMLACEIPTDVAVFVTGNVIVGLLQPLPANARIENGMLKDKLRGREK